MNIDFAKQKIEHALTDFCFFGYELAKKPTTETIKNKSRTTIVFNKLASKNKLELAFVHSPTDSILVCDYVHYGKDDIKTHYNKKYYLDEFEGNWDDLNDDIEFWVAETENDANQNNIVEQNDNAIDFDEQNEYDEVLRLPIDGPYSEADAKLTARLMNEHGLSFYKNKPINQDLRYEPPFTVDNIVDWFDEAYTKLLKLYQNNVVNGNDDEVEYANGPIQMRAFDDGSVVMNISLIHNFMPGQQN